MSKMQAISVSEARQNFKKYCDDVVENNDIIIVSRNGNGRENMVWLDLNVYNDLQKAKENLEYLQSLDENDEDEENSRFKVNVKDNIDEMEDE